MDDLVAFIEARLAEDEARVRNDIEWWFNEATTIRVYDGNTGMLVAGGGDYILPFIDPARTLRGIEVKRLLLEGHEPERGVVSWDINGAPVYGQRCAACGTDDNPEVWPCRHVRLLASEWPTHDDYRQEWTL